MLAVVKTPLIDVKIKGKPSVFLMEALKKEFGRKLVIKEEKEESVDYFSTPLAKTLENKATPGNGVKIYRENLGLTQRELGEKVGVSKNYVSDWENGHRPISKEKAKELGTLFNVSAEHFI